jgi:hypothetical protein
LPASEAEPLAEADDELDDVDVVVEAEPGAEPEVPVVGGGPLK